MTMMTVADLVEALQREPQHLPVYIERYEYTSLAERRAYGTNQHHADPAQIRAVSLEGPHVVIVPEDNWIHRS